jgi:hypothetical protein
MQVDIHRYSELNVTLKIGWGQAINVCLLNLEWVSSY